ncbi:MAG: tRNA uridine-5-carboxymethylaminomethyl(34) synthesis enzyme MnmG, partial [Victivallaceae bacterium]|nr:tRNA uridine-5-carboxymethylaminomethyl(34) synthesis enzyme MnmG [Victivallaceae bacterium]
MVSHYDVIVIGGGHAGTECALAAGRVGAKTLLVTFNLDHIGQMSCNPSIGGVAKGQLVREIDALGGAQGIVAEAAMIQFRMLNSAKGPAVWSPRAQCDKVCYQRGMKLMLENAPNVSILQAEVAGFVVHDEQIEGIVTSIGETICCDALVLCTGTFLGGLLHFGLVHYAGGRAGDPAANLLSEAIGRDLKLPMGRMKTGTPPRVLAKSIDFSQMAEQKSEMEEEFFSFTPESDRPALPCAVRRHMPCYAVYTTDQTAQIARANLDKAPMYRGIIKGIGARYCPSFEDKVVRFAHHPRHLLYLEPEGAETGEYYINGISTSMPMEVQKAMLSTIPGMEHAIVSRYAYAIEYDMLPPSQLTRTFANKQYCNLFTAGQINGTSGYEEAAAQGLAAGLNAARFAAGQSGYEFRRDQSYIGVMIDDLVTKEIVEPYRLFTSRAEYRLHLRQDNADLRLTETAYKLGLVSSARHDAYLKYEKRFAELLAYCQTTKTAGKTLFELLKTRDFDLSTP